MDRRAVDDFTSVGLEESRQFFKIEGDLTATQQDGKEVKLSALNDKVWVVTQFFANCPLCAARNDQDLRRLYNKHKDDPGSQAELQGFLNGKMKFTPVMERTDPDEIAAKGRYAHDFGIAVVRPGFVFGTKRDLKSAREMGDSFHDAAWELLNDQIEQGKREARQE